MYYLLKKYQAVYVSHNILLYILLTKVTRSKYVVRSSTWYVVVRGT